MTSAKKRARWLGASSVGVASLLIALVAARFTSSWIDIHYPDRPSPPDLLFDLLPHVPKLGYVVDLAVVAAIVLLLVHAFRGHAREIPKMLSLYGLMQFSRALINVLTPFGSPLHPGEYYGLSTLVEHPLSSIASWLAEPMQHVVYAGVTVSNGAVHVTQNGEFPSGHMATVMICMLLVDKASSPRIRAVMVALVVIEVVTLLLSHQHYSVDVVGGLWLSYFLYHEYTDGTLLNWLKPLVRV